MRTNKTGSACYENFGVLSIHRYQVVPQFQRALGRTSFPWVASLAGKCGNWVLFTKFAKWGWCQVRAYRLRRFYTQHNTCTTFIEGIDNGLLIPVSVKGAPVVMVQPIAKLRLTDSIAWTATTGRLFRQVVERYFRSPFFLQDNHVESQFADFAAD